MAKELIPFPEDEQLIVRKFYNVRCAVFYRNEKLNEPPIYVPIIGFAHKDPELNDIDAHYHIDGRFIDLRSMGQRRIGWFWINKRGRTNGFMYATFKVVVKKMTCKRLTTGLDITIDRLTGATKWEKWYTKHLNKSCAGRKCPHLGTHMLECNGRLVCPLHNLQGDLKTEVIIEAIKL